jgi:colanic acid/amylovoran biosynthesis protein
MKKIAMSGVDPFNHGDTAVVTSTIKTLRELIPDANLTLLSLVPEIDRGKYEKYGVRVVKAPWVSRFSVPSLMKKVMYRGMPSLFAMFSCILYRTFRPLNIQVKGGLQQYDIFLEMSTDLHVRSYGSAAFYYSFFFLLLCVTMKKPFVMYAASMGPFESKLDKLIAKFFCNRASLITVRDEISMNYLRQLGLDNQNVYLTADPAFLFVSQCSNEKINEILAGQGINQSRQPLVGISPSSFIYRYRLLDIETKSERHKKYVMLMAQVTDYVVEKLDATVIFVPHHPAEGETLVYEEIYQGVRNKSMVKLIGDDYTAEETKGIIGMCQMFIGCKVHSVVASTTMYVPSIAISYSHKFHGILGPILDTQRCIVEVSEYKFDQLLPKLCSVIDYVWENREQITQKLRENMPEVTKRALLNAELVKELLDKS